MAAPQLPPPVAPPPHVPMRPEQLLLFLNRQRLGVPAPQAGAAPPDPQLETLQADIADFEMMREFREFHRMRNEARNAGAGLQQTTGLPAITMPLAATLPVPLAAPSPAPVPMVPPDVAALVAQYGLALVPHPAQAPPALLPQPPEGGHQPDDHK